MSGWPLGKRSASKPRADKPAEKPAFNEAKMEEMLKVLDVMHGGDGVSVKDVACMKAAAAMYKETSSTVAPTPLASASVANMEQKPTS